MTEAQRKQLSQLSIFDDIKKDREAAQTHRFHWIGETLMAKEYDEVVELCSVDWSGLDECEAAGAYERRREG